MSTGAVILLIVVLLIIAVAAAIASTAIRRRHQAGGEFSRLAREGGPWRAMTEYTARRRRVAKLGIKPLSAERRASYERQWTVAQDRFIDSPLQSTTTAAALVAAVAAERGYDVSDTDRLLADLSVHHGQHLDGYRQATRTTEHGDAAPTEELREALLNHRALFRDLLGSSRGSAPQPDADQVPAVRP